MAGMELSDTRHTHTHTHTGYQSEGQGMPEYSLAFHVGFIVECLSLSSDCSSICAQECTYYMAESAGLLSSLLDPFSLVEYSFVIHLSTV